LHERTEHRTAAELAPRAEAGPIQIRLFEPGSDDIKQKIRGLKVDEMRPVEALRFLEELQRELG
jgi:hypothetical protein